MEDNAMCMYTDTDETENLKISENHDGETGVSYIISLIFFFICLILASALIIKPEISDMTVELLKKFQNINISGLLKEYAYGVKNVFC
ncbi:MAG: hypothetical protein PUE12_18915 [Oscillospiraceae bacterium]|nr:hypothetical protein [Oscillospiraceae bacterium]